MGLASEVPGMGWRRREAKEARVIIVLLLSLQVCLGHYPTKVTAPHRWIFFVIVSVQVLLVTTLSPSFFSFLELMAAPHYRPGVPASSFVAPLYLLHTLLNHPDLSVPSLSSATPTNCYGNTKGGHLIQIKNGDGGWQWVNLRFQGSFLGGGGWWSF